MATLYFIKSGLAMAFFYGMYRLLLRKGTHFRLNRIVLLMSLVMACLLPFASFRFFQPIKPALPVLSIVFDHPSAGTGNFEPSTGQPPEFSFWFWIYLAGMSIVLVRLVYQTFSIGRILQKARKAEVSGTDIFFVDRKISPFSYINRIVIPDNTYPELSLRSIVAHELSHLKQFHLIDILLAEILIVFQWFNPFAWLFERLIKENHEYLADEAVLQKGIHQGTYQALLVNEAIGGPVFAMSNQFNQSLIKKRIVMMTKKKTSKMSQFRVLWFVPLIGGLLVTFTDPPSGLANGIATVTAGGDSAKEIVVKGKVVDQSTGKPIGGVHVIIAATTIGTITDDQGDYLVRPAALPAKLVFSYVGFETVQEEIGDRRNISCAMKPERISIDFSGKNQLMAPIKEITSGDPKGDDKGVFVVVEELPSYPGGTDALKELIHKNLIYPQEAKKNHIEGKVLVRFTINEQGKPVDLTIVRSASPLFHKEALRMVSLMDKWNPGMQNGKPVRCLVEVPVEFSLK